MKLTVDVEQPLSNDAVRIRARCLHDGNVLVAGARVAAHHTKPLDAYAVGEQAELNGLLYFNHPPAPCQVSVVVAESGAESIVAEACWDGAGRSDLGACSPPIVPEDVPREGSSIDVFDLTAFPPDIGSGLAVGYSTRFRRAPSPDDQIQVEARCVDGVEERTDTELAWVDPSLELQPGETLRHHAHLTFDDTWFLEESPEQCELAVRHRAGGTAFRPVFTGCFRDGRVHADACTP